MGCGAGAARVAPQSQDEKVQSTHEKSSSVDVADASGAQEKPSCVEVTETPEAEEKLSSVEVTDARIDLQPATTLDEPEASPAETGDAQPSALRKRLISLGQRMSIEVAPSDVDFGVAGAKAVGSKGPKKLLQLQAESAASGKPRVLKEGTPVFVNMVKTTMEHFNDVQAASEALVAAGFSPIPHLPAARFVTAEDCRSTVTALTSAGVSQMLVIGGNDLQEQLAANSCAYSSGACGLLNAELPTLQSAGVKSVAVAGHPDGHPGLSWDEEETASVLLEKARPLLEAGLNVVVASQFCFDARKLVRWLQTSRESLLALRKDILAGGKSCGVVSFCIGLPGPTPLKKLERIANICEVPSLFVSSAFELMDSDQDGVVAWEDFRQAVQTMGLSRRSTTKLASFYGQHADENGLLRPEAFSNMLLDDAMSRQISFGVNVPKEKIEGKEVSGPSKFVNENGDAKDVSPSPSGFVEKVGTGKSDPSRIVWPDELVLTIATYCERNQVQAGEVLLHFFPFGGLARTFELLSEMQAGTWPRLSHELVPSIS